MKEKPASPGPVRPASFPAIPSVRLDNGMAVVVVEDHHVPICYVRMAVRVGRVHSPASNSVLLPVAVELLKEGTEHRSSKRIAEEMDQAAIQFDSDVHLEYSFLSMNALSDELDAMLEFLSEFVRLPTFPQKDLDRTLSQWDSHLLAERSQPSFLGTERQLLTLYGDHPYSRKSMRREDLAHCTRQGVAELFGGLFVPERADLLIAGSVSVGEAEAAARRHFSGWRQPDARIERTPATPPAPSPTLCLVHRPHSVQAHIVIGCRTFSRGHEDAFILKVTNQVLGGGASARLFLNLRERRGMTYGIHSYVRGHLLDGELYIAADVRTESAVDAVEEILDECRLLARNPPDPGELSRAKAELLGHFVLQLETAPSIGGLELARRTYGLPDDYYQTWMSNIRAVSAEDVGDAAARYLDPNRFVITLVGDSDVLAPELSRLGEVQVFDNFGKAL